MSQKFQLYLTSDDILRKTCIETLTIRFKTNVKPWYADPEGNMRFFYKMKLRSDENKWKLAKDIRDAHVGVIEVDPVLFLTGQTGAYENDENYPNNPKWNHSLTHFPDAVSKSLADGKFDVASGTGVKIAQFDTGVTLHPELPVFKDNGYNFVEGNDDVTDQMDNGILRNPGHGTGTASVIVGVVQNDPNNLNDGVFPYVDFIPYRIARSVVHFINSNIDEAILHAINKGVHIITMSMGGAPPRRSWREACELAYQKGIIFCSAAGNNVGFVVWPAAYEEVVAVAAVNTNSLSWSGSCRGPAVEICAPGEKVYVARSNKDGDNWIYDYGYGSGTSHATPHVAAAAALWLNYFKDELKDSQPPSEKVDLFRTALRLSATKHIFDHQSNYGAGVLNASELLQYSPQVIKTSHASELAKTQRMQKASRGLESRYEEFSLAQKELLDIMTNNEHSSYAALKNFVKNEGTLDANLAFDAIAPKVSAATVESSRSGGKDNIQEIKATLSAAVIEGNF